jgi:hypothetical protein
MPVRPPNLVYTPMVEVPAASAMRRTVSSAGPCRSSSSRPASTSRSRSPSRSGAGAADGVARRAPPAPLTNLALLAALLLAFATGVGLVAPGRRGFWWVKWVDRIELQDTPPGGGSRPSPTT